MTMHPLSASLAVVLALAGLAAPPATAGTLFSATWNTQITGYFGDLTVAVPVMATGSSTDSAISVSLTLPDFEHTSLHQPAPPFSTFFAPTHRKLALSGVQTIAATAGMASADTAIAGHALVRVAEHVTKGANASISVPRTTLFGFPLRVGLDGVTTGYFYNAFTFHYATVDFYAWTPGAHTFTGLTLKGVPLPSVKVGGSFALTAQGGGTVTLVAPARIAIDSTGPNLIGQQRTVSVSTLKLTFVPEPSVGLLLVGAGLAYLFAPRGRARA
jgi:hypothetical protein